MEMERTMLFFCEECGGKNMVADGSANRGKIRFRCQFCHYETVVEAGEEKTPAAVMSASKVFFINYGFSGQISERL